MLSRQHIIGGQVIAIEPSLQQITFADAQLEHLQVLVLHKLLVHCETKCMRVQITDAFAVKVLLTWEYLQLNLT